MSWLDCYDGIHVNRTLTKMTNPTVGVYFAELLTALMEVKSKNKADPNTGMWKLDRVRMREATGIGVQEQKRCEEILAKLGILFSDASEDARLAVDMRKYTETVYGGGMPDVRPLSKTMTMTAEERKAAKKEGITLRIVGLWKSDFQPEDPEYPIVKNLVEVYYGKGVCRDVQWKPIFKMLHAAAQDFGALEEIVDYALATNYTSLPAAIDSFMKKHQTVALGEQKISNGDLYGVDF